ncbi:MAG: PspC domain-containing protein [Kosmotogaceae bacterium]|nr:PspC domain-containing protein [Kosmotogaceae bacterium]
MSDAKRLYKSRKDKVIDGLAGGIAEYLGIDPVIVRLVFVALVFAGGAGLIIYIIGMFIVPRAPINSENNVVIMDEEGKPIEEGKKEEFSDNKSKLIIAVLLIVFGIALLLGSFTPWNIFSGIFWKIVIGVVLIAGGGFVIYKSINRG